MELFWTIFFWLVPIWVFVLIPFSTFYYESDDGMLMAGTSVNPNPIKKSRVAQALCNLMVVLVIVGIIFLLTYLFLSDTNIPVREYTGAGIPEAGPAGVVLTSEPRLNLTLGQPLPFSPAEDLQAVSPTTDGLLLQLVLRNSTLQDITLQVDVATFYAGLMAFAGWFLFALFGGIGLAAMPMDLIIAYTHRPRHMSPEEFAEAKLSIQERVNEMVDIGEQLKREREEKEKTAQSSSGFGSFFSLEKRKEAGAERRTMKEFKAAVFLLEKDVEDFQACSADMEKYNPLLPYINLFLGILSFILSFFWVVHIALFVLPNRALSTFLNVYFEWFDGWFPLFGVLSVALFTVYLLFCAVKGCFKFGLRFLFFTVHPMKIGATYMSSFMFNIGLVLLCSLPVVQFATTAFADYARFSTVRQLFGVQIENLQFFNYFWRNNVFIYALLAVAALTTLFLICRPKHASKDGQALRDRLKSRRA